MKRLTSLIFILGFILFSVISVKADGMELKSIDAIIAEIRQEQNISRSEPIDITKVSYAKLEELGDSVMEKVIGNTEAHERIDTTLGGDGSAALTRVHIRVGYSYLAGIPITMMTFMGAGGMMSYGNMIGGIAYYDQTGVTPSYMGMMSGFGWVWMLIGLLGLIALIGGVIYLTTQGTRHTVITSNSKTLNILKERYARGEITKEEYTRMMDDLK